MQLNRYGPSRGLYPLYLNLPLAGENKTRETNKKEQKCKNTVIKLFLYSFVTDVKPVHNCLLLVFVTAKKQGYSIYGIKAVMEPKTFYGVG